MTQNLKIAEQMVKRLIADTNRAHFQETWRYELTNEVDNIDVVSEHGTNTLRIHPCWLRYIVVRGRLPVVASPTRSPPGTCSTS